MKTDAARLELPVDKSFQRFEWRVQRLSWAVWALILTAALLGFFGPGPFSNRVAQSEGGELAVSYERFVHYHNPTEIKLTLLKRNGDSNRAEVFVAHSLLQRLEVQRIEPEPIESRIGEDGVTYVFSFPAGSARGEIIYRVGFEKYGSATGVIKLGGNSGVTINQFVYP